MGTTNCRLCRQTGEHEKESRVFSPRPADRSCGREGSGRAQHTFETYTEDLVRLRTWLTQSKVTHAAMESSGVYWKPVGNILGPGKFEKPLVNPQRFHGLPGQKTDPNDSRCVAELLSCGLLRASFVPPQPSSASAEKRSSKGCWRAGMEFLAERACSHMRKKIPDLKRALKGRVSNITGGCSNNYPAIWTRWIPGLCQSSNRSSRQVKPFEDRIQRLCTIPGVNIITAGRSWLRSEWI